MGRGSRKKYGYREQGRYEFEEQEAKAKRAGGAYGKSTFLRPDPLHQSIS
jgi:hypothetical protein